MSKPFSKALYDQNNDFGIKTAMSFLQSQGYQFVNANEAYRSHDLIVEKDNKQYKVEVEVSRIWKSLPFPFRTMTVPYRKHHSQADFFIQTNVLGNSLHFCPMSTVKGANVITKDTCYTANEKFFSVSLPKLQHFIFQDGSWSLD
jgi:Holliday junction resolvase-like predicted endonuclease